MEKYIVITGATGAIGFEIARALYGEGENLILACRNAEKADAVRLKLIGEFGERGDIRCQSLDLARMDSVRDFVRAIKPFAVKALINNAGVMNRHYTTDEPGREMTMAVNFHNTRELTLLMLSEFDTITNVVFTTSLTRFLHRKNRDVTAVDDVDSHSFSQLGTYGRSKRALTDFAIRLSHEGRPGLTVACADPGVVNSSMLAMHRGFDRLTDLIFRPFTRCPAHGAIPAVRAVRAARGPRIYCRHLTHSLK